MPGGRPKLGDSEMKRFGMVLSEDELTAIGKWRAMNGVASKSDAIRKLVQIGLRQTVRMHDQDRRQLYISDMVCRHGSVSRLDIIREFGVSVQQSAMDIKRWLAEHPKATSYNTFTRRHDRAA